MHAYFYDWRTRDGAMLKAITLIVFAENRKQADAKFCDMTALIPVPDPVADRYGHGFIHREHSTFLNAPHGNFMLDVPCEHWSVVELTEQTRHPALHKYVAEPNSPTSAEIWEPQTAMTLDEYLTPTPPFRATEYTYAELVRLFTEPLVKRMIAQGRITQVRSEEEYDGWEIKPDSNPPHSEGC